MQHAWVREMAMACLDWRNLRQSIILAGIVGTVLFFINQSQVVFGGQADAGTWIRIGLTYVVPFVVCNYGIVVGATKRTAGE